VKGINVFEMEKEGMFAILPILAKIINMCEQTFNHTDVQKLIHSGDKFDVVIVELLMNDAHNILASHFNAPLVLFSTVGVNTWINQLCSWKSTTPRLRTGCISRIFRQNVIFPKIT
jgi:hypothetical protein